MNIFVVHMNELHVLLSLGNKLWCYMKFNFKKPEKVNVFLLK